MTESQHIKAVQRHKAYLLLSKIFAEGITTATISLCKDIPSLNPVLPEIYDEDASSATYQDLFGFNVLPFAGVYLSEDGRLGGELHHQLNTWFLSHEFEQSLSTNTPPDHISTQLAFLAHLCAAEATTPHKNTAALLSQTQLRFLHEHLLVWALPFLFALKKQEQPFFTEVADLTEALILDHALIPEADELIRYDFPDLPDILNQQKSGIKHIAEYLIRPIYSGIYFSKRDIRLLAGQLNIPTGFGDRTQMLSNTFRSAINFDLLPQFLSALKDHAQSFNNAYSSLKTVEHQNLHHILLAWIDRSLKTIQLIETIEEAGLSVEHDD